MSPRTGRPPKGDTRKDQRLQIRMSKEELQTLDECTRRMSATRTDVVIEGITLVKQRLDEGK